jgi:hypothetical protein
VQTEDSNADMKLAITIVCKFLRENAGRIWERRCESILSRKTGDDLLFPADNPIS